MKFYDGGAHGNRTRRTSPREAKSGDKGERHRARSFLEVQLHIGLLLAVRLSAFGLFE